MTASSTYKVNSSSQVRAVVFCEVLENFCTGSFSRTIHTGLALPVIRQKATISLYFSLLVGSRHFAYKRKAELAACVLAFLLLSVHLQPLSTYSGVADSHQLDVHSSRLPPSHTPPRSALTVGTAPGGGCPPGVTLRRYMGPTLDKTN